MRLQQELNNRVVEPVHPRRMRSIKKGRKSAFALKKSVRQVSGGIRVRRRFAQKMGCRKEYFLRLTLIPYALANLAIFSWFSTPLLT